MADKEYIEESVIDFSKYFALFKAHWKTILKWTAVSFVLGIVLALMMPRKYTVVAKLAPELTPSTTNRLGGSVSALMGLSNAILGSTDAVYPMVYPDVISSPYFIADLLSTPVSFTYKKENVDTTLYAYLKDYQSGKALGAIIGFPKTCIGFVTGLFNKKDEQVSQSDTINPFAFTKEQDAVARMLSKSINADVDKKTLSLVLSVTMQNPVVCATTANAISENLQKCVKEYRVGKLLEEAEYYKTLVDEAREGYYTAQDEYSRYVDSHQSVSQKSYIIKTDRLRNEMNLAYQLYMSMSNQYQQAKAKVHQDTPVFAETISPTVPLRSSNSKKSTALTITFFGFLASLVYVFFKYRSKE